jgi:hypothetical protein
MENHKSANQLLVLLKPILIISANDHLEYDEKVKCLFVGTSLIKSSKGLSARKVCLWRKDARNVPNDQFSR